MQSPLIGVDELREALADGDHDRVVLDVRYWLTEPERGRAEYAAGHLPGAVFIDLDADLAAPTRADGCGGRHRLPDPTDLQQVFRRAGVGEQSSVVIYDQGPSLGAARAWWLLTDGGQPDVRVLDGGYRAWLAAGGEVSSVIPQPAAGDVVLRPGQLLQVDAAGVQAALEAGRTVADVRTSERFRGEHEPIDRVAGHIPGARSIPAGGVSTAEGFASPEVIRAQLGGLQPGDLLSCGSGITAAQVLLAAESAGVRGLGIYPGSWSDWISDPARPIAVGEE